MKSTFGQITAADIKKGFSRITFQLESDDSVFDSVFHNLFSKETRRMREKEAKKIVKQILKPHKDFNYDKQ